MEIGNTIVNTPYDTYPQYDPSWRHQVAMAIAANDSVIVPDEISNDKWIKEHVAFQRSMGPNGVKDSDLWMHKIVLSWYTNSEAVSDTKARLEALLLTEVGFDVIAKDIVGNKYGPELIQIYERLFYDCREEDGTDCAAPFRRTWLSRPRDVRIDGNTGMDIYWKSIAAEFGYAGLMHDWIMPGSHGPQPTTNQSYEMQRTLLSKLGLERSQRGTIGNMDISLIHRNVLEHDKLLAETKTQGNLGFDSYVATIGILKEVAPEKIHIVMSDKALKEADEALRSRITSGKQIDGQAVTDLGAQQSHDALYAQMQSIVDGKKKELTTGSVGGESK